MAAAGGRVRRPRPSLHPAARGPVRRHPNSDDRVAAAHEALTPRRPAVYRTGPNTTGRTRATLLVTFLAMIIIAQFVLFLAVYRPHTPAARAARAS